MNVSELIRELQRFPKTATVRSGWDAGLGGTRYRPAVRIDKLGDEVALVGVARIPKTTDQPVARKTPAKVQPVKSVTIHKLPARKGQPANTPFAGHARAAQEAQATRKANQDAATKRAAAKSSPTKVAAVSKGAAIRKGAAKVGGKPDLTVVPARRTVRSATARTR